MENNSQIKLDTGKFLGKCVFSSKISAFLALAFAIVSVIGGIMKLGECAGETDLRILYTAGIVINVMMAFFIIHTFFFGAKEGQTGFLELPMIGFEVLAFAYYILYGYLRLSRLAKLSGLLPQVMGWAYAIYIMLIATSCAVVLSFLKSGFIMKQMSSMLAFLATLGTISSIVLAISYAVCLVKGQYSPDEFILFSFADTLLLLVAPILLIGYWKLFARAGSDIETTFQRIYRKLLKNVAIIDLDDEEQPLKKEEKRYAAKTKSNSKNIPRDPTGQEQFVDYFSIPFDKTPGKDREQTKTEGKNS